MSKPEPTPTSLYLYAVTQNGALPLPVPAGASGFKDLYSDVALGVYTAFRSFEHRKFLHLDRHLRRLRDSIARAGLDHELNEPALRTALDKVCTACSAIEMQVRIDVLSAAANDSDSRVLIALAPFAPPAESVYATGVRVSTTREISRADPLTKSADFVTQRAALESRLGDAYEVLMVDQCGYLLEGLRSNFYAVCDGTLMTPRSGTLHGVTQSILQSLALQLAIPLEHQAVHYDALPQLEEAAISASSKGLVPVVAIDAQRVGHGRPGPIIGALLQAYRSYVNQHILPAVD